MNSNKQFTTTATQWAPGYSFTDDRGAQREIGAIYCDDVTEQPLEPSQVVVVTPDTKPIAVCPRCKQGFVGAGSKTAEFCRDLHYYGTAVEGSRCACPNPDSWRTRLIACWLASSSCRTSRPNSSGTDWRGWCGDDDSDRARRP